MKYVLFVVLSFIVVFDTFADIDPPPSTGPTPQCDVFNSCLLFNSNQDIIGTYLYPSPLQSASHFYYGYDCNGTKLFTKRLSYILDFPDIENVFRHSFSWLNYCGANYSMPSNNAYDLTDDFNSLHWAGKMSLDYFKNIHSVQNISSNNTHIQTLNTDVNFFGGTLINYIELFYPINASSLDMFYTSPGQSFAYVGALPYEMNSFSIPYKMFYTNNSNISYISQPLVSLDLVGKNWAFIHMNNLNFYIDYLQSYEGASVLSSYTSIFGLLIEFYAEQLYDTNKNGDWTIGEDFCVSTPDITAIENFEDPLTSYQTKYYSSNTVYALRTKEAGPHNYWFYLLANGGSGVNDNGYCYDVSGIGIDDAGDIIYLAMSTFLSKTATSYEDSKNATIAAAHQLFPPDPVTGVLSIQEKTVIEAWQAVGVIAPPSTMPGGNTAPSGTVTTINSAVEINGIYTIPYGASVIVNNTSVFVGHNAKIIIEDGGSLQINNTTVNLGQHAEIHKEIGLGYFKTDNSTYQYGEICPAQTNEPFWNGFYLHSNTNNSIEITNCTIKDAKFGIDMDAAHFIFDGNIYKDNLQPLKIVNAYQTSNQITNCEFVNTMHFPNIANQSNFMFIQKYSPSDLIISNNEFYTWFEDVNVTAVQEINPTTSSTWRSKLIFNNNEISEITTTVNSIGNIEFFMANNYFTEIWENESSIRCINNFDVQINNNYFTEVSNCVYLQGVSNANISQNHFFMPNQNFNFDQHAVEIVSSNCNVVENTFNNSNSTFNSGWKIPIVLDNMGEQISEIRNNTINSDLFGIWTQGNNSGAKIKCNTFTPAIAIVVIDGTIHEMGASCGTAYNNANWQQAGNEFLQPGLLYKGTNATEDFNYWAHKETSAGAQVTTPIMAGSWTNANLSLRQCDDNDMQDPNNNSSPTWPTQIKDANSCDIGGWKLAYNPDFQGINTAITNLLVEKTAFVNTANTLNINLTNPDTQEDLVRKVDAVQREITTVNKKLSELYEKAGNSLASKNILETATSIEAKIELLKKYTANEMFVDADRIRAELANLYKQDYFFTDYTEEDNYDWNKLYYTELEELKKTVNLSSRNLDELTSAEIQNLRIIKSEGLKSSDIAEGILIINGDSIIEHPIRKANINIANFIDSSNVDTFNYNLTVSPNPASSFIDISYLLPIGTTNATIQLLDQYNNIGNQVNSVSLVGAQTNYTINVANIANGYYSVVLSVNGNSKMTKLLQIIR